ncbi:MAG: DUF1800 family protein [Acidimicrobiales bacterium]
MDATQSVSWMARRLTMGAGVASLESMLAAGPEATKLQLVDPDGEGIEAAGSPWAGYDVPDEPDREETPRLLAAWLEHMRTTPRPFETWIGWFWHDHFAVSAGVVRYLPAFVAHIDMVTSLGLGAFDKMLRQVTTDPAMLAFLDGRQNRRGEVNENYGRELLELYALGIGNYDEDDVRAAAVALSGWAWRPGLSEARFVPSRHDPTPQTLLGSTVDDVDSVIDTVTSARACARHITSRLAAAILGWVPAGAEFDRLADGFEDTALDIRHLVDALIDIALEGGSVPIVMSPIAWFNQVESLTNAELEPQMRLALLRQMGQLPGVPPNVGGYPGADTWAGPSSTVGRFRAASVIASRTPDAAPILEAADQRAWDEVARLAARPDGFSSETLRSLDGTNTSRRSGREALAAVLMSPEMVVA